MPSDPKDSARRIIYRLRGGLSTDPATWVLDVDATAAPVTGRYLQMGIRSVNGGWLCRYAMTDDLVDDDPMYHDAVVTIFQFLAATQWNPESAQGGS